MARTKQATPLRREPSSEFVSKGEVNRTSTRSSRELPIGEVISAGTTNGISIGKIVEEKKEAGALQLIFAVAGIYGSLYASLLLIQVFHANNVTVSHGHSSKNA